MKGRKKFMQNNRGILEKVNFLIIKSIEKKYNEDDLKIILSYLDEHTDNLIYRNPRLHHLLSGIICFLGGMYMKIKLVIIII